MGSQAFNPYMPSFEYVPDGEPHIVGDRVYVYGSHDIFNGLSFCMGDYVCYSAPIDNLADWRYEGVIFRREQEPGAKGLRCVNGLAAPDMIQGDDGRFYLYYFIGGTGMISVAVCDEPAGKYKFYGYVKYTDDVPIGKKNEPFQFDPGVFRDDDGKIYLYTGFALESNPFLLGGHKPTKKGPMVFEINPSDMLTVIAGPSYIGLEDKAHPFLEASSMRKFDGTYYYIYSSKLSHELCYATSDNPTSGFKYQGTLVSNGDIGIGDCVDVRHAKNNTGNTHGSLIKIKDKYYVFYHRHSNRKQSSRQACAEEIKFENGRFYQAEMTSCGLNGKPLKGSGTYPAYICCNLYGKDGTRFLSMIKHPKAHTPFLTQDGPDRNSGRDQFIANFCDGSVAVYKYFDTTLTKKIGICVKGKAKGVVNVMDCDSKAVLATIEIDVSNNKEKFYGAFNGGTHRQGICFSYKGKGSFNFYSFRIA
jgi:hypothetical protein